MASRLRTLIAVQFDHNAEVQPRVVSQCWPDGTRYRRPKPSDRHGHQAELTHLLPGTRAGKQSSRDGSPLKGKIAVNKIAAMGSSCGGFLSIEVGADPRVKTVGVFNSGVMHLDPKVVSAASF